MGVEDQTIKVELEDEVPSSTGLYQCLPCEYAGKDPRNYTKHLKTQKHRKIVMGERYQLEEEDRVALARETSRKQGERAPTVTSSGRKVIPKRFIGYEEESDAKYSPSVKRRKVENGSSPALSGLRGLEKRGEDQRDQEAGAPLRQWTCQFCPILSSSPKELFTHMATHVPPEVIASAGLQPDQGWCPFCPGPVGLARATNHLSVVHPHA